MNHVVTTCKMQRTERRAGGLGRARGRGRLYPAGGVGDHARGQQLDPQHGRRLGLLLEPHQHGDGDKASAQRPDQRVPECGDALPLRVRDEQLEDGLGPALVQREGQ